MGSVNMPPALANFAKKKETFYSIVTNRVTNSLPLALVEDTTLQMNE